MNKLIFFLREKIEFKTFVILTSILVGILSGLAAVILKKIVHFLQEKPSTLFNYWGIDFLLPFTPVLGIILSVFIVNFFFGGKISKGLSNIIYMISRRTSNVPRRKIISHLLTSGVTVGLGGSAGLEAPIVVIGSTIGSNLAKDLKFDYQIRTLLLASGAAAGISAIFNSPIAGVVFAFEVMLPEITVSSFIPLLIASASSAVVSKFLYSGQLFYLVTTGWHLYAMPYYVLLGIFCGFISLYIIKATFALENLAEKFRKPYTKAVVGGLLLCLLVYLVPPLYGEGYSSIITLLSGKFANILQNSFFNNLADKNLALIIFTVLIVFSKVIATSLTISSGGNGGIIAPSLFTGAMTGFLLTHTMNYLGLAELDRINFIVVGMAGILSGVLHSPLTGIFLIAEVTGGYVLIVPLMIVTALSFFISKHFHHDSIYIAPLVKDGIKFRSEKERYFIQQMKISDLVEKDFVAILPNMTLRQLVDKITHTNRNLFPVVNENKKLVGIVTLDDVREVMLTTEAYDVILVDEIMNTGYNEIDISADINNVLELFKGKQIWNLAVTDKGTYLGFISKSNLFNNYISVWEHQKKDEM